MWEMKDDIQTSIKKTIAFLRERARFHAVKSKDYTEAADTLERIKIGKNGHSNLVPTPFKGDLALGGTGPIAGSLTPELLEKSVTKKNGRVGDLAARLGVSIEEVENLLDPASKVYKGAKGWLKVK